MKKLIFLTALFAVLGFSERAHAYDGHPIRDAGAGCLAGGAAFASYGAYQGLKQGHPWWKDEAWEGAVIGCGVGTVVGAATSLALPSDAPSEDDLKAEEPAGASDQE